jgi:cell division protein FtsL
MSGGLKVYTVLVISIIIVIVVLILSLVTTTKAYDYKHSIDSLEDNQHLQAMDHDDKKQEEIDPK